MDFDSFRKSLRNERPPGGIGPAAEALWWDAHGEWAAAHECAQRDEGPAGAWVHAYLHRKEGDLGNADYWYRRAGRSNPAITPEEEWRLIAVALLAQA